MEKKGKGGRALSIVADLIQVLHKPNESTGRSIASRVGKETPPQKEQKESPEMLIITQSCRNQPGSPQTNLRLPPLFFLCTVPN